MSPELFRLPFVGWSIHSFGMMVVLGFLAAYVVVRIGARREGIPKESIQDLPIWMVLSGLAGARLFYVIQFYDESYDDGRWHHAFRIWEGGLVFYGGLIFGTAAFILYCRRHRLPLLRMTDIAAPSVALGLAFGRIGCFLNGCCFGRACDPSFPLGVRFPAESLPMRVHDPGTAIHPTQLYESAVAATLALLLWALARRRPAPGLVFAGLLVGYGASRFVLEGIRGDHDVPLGAWTVSGWLSVAILLSGVAFGAFALGRRTELSESVPPAPEASQ